MRLIHVVGVAKEIGEVRDTINDDVESWGISSEKHIFFVDEDLFSDEKVVLEQYCVKRDYSRYE